MRRIDLAGFDAKFLADSDPWLTFVDADEAAKRRVILRALGLGRLGRVWEPASGAGANSVALSSRAMRLDATDGSAAAVRLTATVLKGISRAHTSKVALPAAPPHPRYDAVVVAELLYYLTPHEMELFARSLTRVLRRGGRLVLAHHRRTFYDFAQRASGIHSRFLGATGAEWRRAHGGAATRRWIVQGYDRLS